MTLTYSVARTRSSTRSARYRSGGFHHERVRFRVCGGDLRRVEKSHRNRRGCGKRRRAFCARPSSVGTSRTRSTPETAPSTAPRSTSRSRTRSVAGGNARRSRSTSTYPNASTSPIARPKTRASVRGCFTVRSSALSSASSAFHRAYERQSSVVARADAGDRLPIADRHAEMAQQVADELRAHGGRIEVYDQNEPMRVKIAKAQGQRVPSCSSSVTRKSRMERWRIYRRRRHRG